MRSGILALSLAGILLTGGCATTRVKTAMNPPNISYGKTRKVMDLVKTSTRFHVTFASFIDEGNGPPPCTSSSGLYMEVTGKEIGYSRPDAKITVTNNIYNCSPIPELNISIEDKDFYLSFYDNPGVPEQPHTEADGIVVEVYKDRSRGIQGQTTQFSDRA
jgi:hypothetical protein